MLNLLKYKRSNYINSINILHVQLLSTLPTKADRAIFDKIDFFKNKISRLNKRIDKLSNVLSLLIRYKK